MKTVAMKILELLKNTSFQIFVFLMIVLFMLLIPIINMLKPWHVMSTREIVKSVHECHEAQLPLEINRNIITNEITSIQCKPE